MNAVSVFLIFIIFSFKHHEVVCESIPMYKGCFRDGGINNRLFKDENQTFNFLTPERCNKHCLDRGFAYAGTMASTQCFCSDTKPPDSKKIADSRCDSVCPGDITKKCGGRTKLSVFSTGTPQQSDLDEPQLSLRILRWRVTTRRLPDLYQLFHNRPSPFEPQDVGLTIRTTLFINRGETGWNSVGCFNDTMNRIFYGPQEVFPVTNNNCITHCSLKGYNYAGTEYGSQCFCGNEKPGSELVLSPDKCKMPCSGDILQYCGGVWALSVYSNIIPPMTGDDGDVFNWSQIGCFVDSPGRIFPDHQRDFPSSLTDQNCIAYCSKKGFRYAGIQYGMQCFCGNEQPNVDLKVNTEECNMPCSGDRDKTCGGRWRMTVYTKNVPVPGSSTAVLKPIGCFNDTKNNRVLPEYIRIQAPLTSRKCIKQCAQRDYLYAGTENGVYCFCGNFKPIRNREVGMEKCNKPCPGDQTQNCGGYFQLAAYSTQDAPSATVTPPTVQTTAKPAVQMTQKSTIQTTPMPTVQTTPMTTVQTTQKSTVQTTKKSCVNYSQTLVNGVQACKDEVIFDEQFSSGLVDRWKYDIMFPNNAELGFAFFNSDSKNIYTTANGLTIKPTIINDIFVQQGSLTLKGCTGNSTEQCSHQAHPDNILPPVESARIHTRDSFSFRYGIVEIRAKLPRGDWLVPELWLEPLNHIYGPGYASGRLRLAMNRGNANFMCNGEDLGSNLMESGVVMGPPHNVRIRSIKTNLPANWHSDFHNYILKWTPELISFQIDNGPPQELYRDTGVKLCEVVGFKKEECLTATSMLNIAPFEQNFYISLGLSVGSSWDFPDDCTNSGKPKPWKNTDEKPMFKFWQDRENWKGTWSEENSSLYIEHIRVTAL